MSYSTAFEHGMKEDFNNRQNMYESPTQFYWEHYECLDKSHSQCYANA